MMPFEHHETPVAVAGDFERWSGVTNGQGAVREHLRASAEADVFLAPNVSPG